MIWVSWRQHRAQLAVAALVATIFAIAVVVTGIPLHDAVARLDPSCLGGGLVSATCRGLRDSIDAQYAVTSTLVVIGSTVLSTLIGVFLGAPVVAAEIEQGTHRLAWTQSVSRERWLLVKIGVLGGATIVAAAVFAALVGWWRSPLDALEGTPWAAYDGEGLVPIASALFGFALGLALGSFLRRTVPAIALSFAAVAGIKALLVLVARPYLFSPPMTASWAPGATPPFAAVPGWYFDLYPVSAAGGRLSSEALVAVVQGTGADDPTRGMQLAGVTWTQVFQTAERYWPFQSIESVMLLLATVAVLVLAMWWVARRT